MLNFFAVVFKINERSEYCYISLAEIFVFFKSNERSAYSYIGLADFFKFFFQEIVFTLAKQSVVV